MGINCGLTLSESVCERRGYRDWKEKTILIEAVSVRAGPDVVESI